ncbi:MAG: hypothetical protein JRI23_31700 [Deltaproteobacteria bacterium]|jgi:hypothetical protein|nr:hypothetical protein [Deltaproteobacteria bacterium]MBW2536786.1 hypothetical protein [Deltaproteobacteria bacterium]
MRRVKALGALALALLLATACSSSDDGGDGGSGGTGGTTTTPTGTGGGVAGTCAESWPLKRWLLLYGGELVGSATDAELDAIAQRFEFSVGDPPETVRDLTQRPGSVFRGAYRYNSLTDNYVASQSGTPEHDWLTDPVRALPDDGAYLHYWVDTTITLQGETITIPGWQPDSPKAGASADGPEQARIPVYYADLSRRATHFGTQAARDLHRDYNVERVLGQPVIDDIYPLGVMFDNSSPAVYNFGDIVSGGEVREHPSHAVFGSDEYDQWHWFEGIGRFMNELRAHLTDHPELLSGRSADIMPNVSNTPWISAGTAWEDAYTNFLVGGGFSLLEEFQYSPTRSYGASMVEAIFAKESAAHEAGIHTVHPGFATLTVSSVAGQYTRDQAVMNNLGLQWVVRSSSPSADVHTYFLGVQENSPAMSWDEWSTNLLPAFDADLGQPDGPPFVLAEGEDGKGYAYRVYGRRFSCGLAAARIRGSYDEDFDEPTAVEVDLGEELIPVSPAGEMPGATASWSFRNGSGQIFLRP